MFTSKIGWKNNDKMIWVESFGFGMSVHNKVKIKLSSVTMYN
jgi:hypothetical protein